MTSRALAVGVGVLLSSASTAGAAGDSVTVTVSPPAVKAGASFHISVSGISHGTSVLWLYLDFRRCATNQGGEARRHVPAQRTVVSSLFGIGPQPATSRRSGVDHVCAYLVAGGRTQASDSVTFRVTR